MATKKEAIRLKSLRYIMKHMNMKKKCTLFASQEFIQSNDRASVANGCGPSGLKSIPDKILWKVNIKPACMIHDFDYALGETFEDKARADRIFLNNMIRSIDATIKTRFLRFPFKLIAAIYYISVVLWGGPAFWNDKNKSHETTEIEL